MNSAITSQEKTIAAVSHASILLLFFGPILPLIMWMSARRKSKYAAFQSLQALTYQIIVLWVGLLVALLGIIIGLDIMYANGSFSHVQAENARELTDTINGLISGITFAVTIIFSIAGLIGAIYSVLGKPFYYPLFGRKLESYLMDEEVLNERKEDQLAAAACHTSALVLLWGLITPILPVAIQKEKSPFLRFQATQALWLQVSMLAFCFFAVFGLFVLAAGGVMGLKLYASDQTVVLLVLAMAILLYLIIFLLIFPLFHVFAFIACVRVLQGKEYQYPILGKIIARKLEYNT